MFTRREYTNGKFKRSMLHQVIMRLFSGSDSDEVVYEMFNATFIRKIIDFESEVNVNCPDQNRRTGLDNST